MFQPWIGRRYGENSNSIRGCRLLILGESHYSEDSSLTGKTSDITSEVIDSYAIKSRYRFFTNILQTVMGCKRTSMTEGDVENFWHSVAFYNYVPVFVGTGARQRPTKEMFEAGAEAFETALKFTTPCAVLVCGFDTWWWMMNGLDAKGNKSEDFYFYQKDNIAFGRIQHPSTGFNSEKWHPVAQRLFELCEESRST